MKRIVQKSISLTLILLVLAGCFLPGISHAVENVSMRIGYKLDGVTSVSKGMPFGATFYFNFDDDKHRIGQMIRRRCQRHGVRCGALQKEL